MSVSTLSSSQHLGKALSHAGLITVGLFSAVSLVATWTVVHWAASAEKIFGTTVVLLITIIQIATLRKRSGIPVPATATVIAGVNLIGLGGFLFYRQISHGAAVSAVLPETNEVYRDSALIFATASLAFWGGALLVGKGPGAVRLNILQVMRAMSPKVTILVGSAPMVFTIIGFTPNALIQREHHLYAYGPVSAVSAGSLSMPVGLAVLSFAMFDRRHAFTTRCVAALINAATVLILFTVGTRQMALLPALLLAGWVLSPPQTNGRSSHKVRICSALATLSTLPLLQLPLTLRGHAVGAGWSPFTHYLSANPGSLLQIDVAAIFGNVLFSFPLAGTVYEQTGGTLPVHYFITGVSPLPSRYTDWQTVYPQLGLNHSTPFNGVGELASYGWIFLLLYPAAVGFVLAKIQKAAQNLSPTPATILSLASLGVAAVFTYALIQYNLRTGIRGVWYLLILTLVIKALDGGSKFQRARQ